MGWLDVADHDADPPQGTGGYVCDEEEQARHLREMMAVSGEEGVDTVFWFIFAGYECPHHTDPRLDLGLTSFGVCKLIPNGKLAAEVLPRHGRGIPINARTATQPFDRLLTRYADLTTTREAALIGM